MKAMHTTNVQVQVWLASQLMGDPTRCKSRFCPFAYAARRKRNCPGGKPRSVPRTLGVGAPTINRGKPRAKPPP